LYQRGANRDGAHFKSVSPIACGINLNQYYLGVEYAMA
jgi:hypothetical protein